MKFIKGFLSELGAYLDKNRKANLLVEMFTSVSRHNLVSFGSNDSRTIYLYGTTIDQVHIYAHAGAYDIDFTPSEFSGYRIDTTNQILSLEIRGEWKHIYFGPDYVEKKRLEELMSNANKLLEKYNAKILVEDGKVVCPTVKNKGLLNRFKFIISEEENAWKLKCTKWPKNGDLATCIERNNELMADLDELNNCLSLIPASSHQKAVSFRLV